MAYGWPPAAAPCSEGGGRQQWRHDPGQGSHRAWQGWPQDRGACGQAVFRLDGEVLLLVLPRRSTQEEGAPAASPGCAGCSALLGRNGAPQEYFLELLRTSRGGLRNSPLRGSNSPRPFSRCALSVAKKYSWGAPCAARRRRGQDQHRSQFPPPTVVLWWCSGFSPVERRATQASRGKSASTV